ncbi:hypothetical protein E2320_001475, partial [Naja naja]
GQTRQGSQVPVGREQTSKRALSTVKIGRAGWRIILCPHGRSAGKSTLLKKLLKDYDSVFGFSVS